MNGPRRRLYVGEVANMQSINRSFLDARSFAGKGARRRHESVLCRSSRRDLADRSRTQYESWRWLHQILCRNASTECMRLNRGKCEAVQKDGEKTAEWTELLLDGYGRRPDSYGKANNRDAVRRDRVDS